MYIAFGSDKTASIIDILSDKDDQIILNKLCFNDVIEVVELGMIIVSISLTYILGAQSCKN
jgi:hypothetical protein